MIRLFRIFFKSSRRSDKKADERLKADSALRWKKLQEERGAFDYDADGFSYPFENGASQIRWSEVERVIGYKLDLFTVDEICLELHVGDRAIRFSESTPGWYQFLDRLRTVFPVIRENWDWEVAMPAFTGNYTVLYERENADLYG